MTEEKAKEPVICIYRAMVEQVSSAANVPFCNAASIIYHTPGAAVGVERGLAETNQELLQVIPYVVVMKDGKILTYRRGKSGGEDRLHDKYSIGIGGHINLADCAKAAAIGCVTASPADSLPHMQCIVREINEELSWNAENSKNKPALHPLCWFYDDSNEVSKVHICACYALELPGELEVSPGEDSVKQLEWHTTEELASDDIAAKLESWSKLATGIVEAWLKDPNAEKVYNKPVDAEDIAEEAASTVDTES